MPSLAARHGLEAAMWRRDRRPTEKQAPAGKLAGVGALGTHKAGQSAPESWSGRASPRTLTRLAMITTATSKSVETDHVIAYRATDLEENDLYSLTLN